MIKEAIVKLTKSEDLSYKEAEKVMSEIMKGEASQIQISAFLVALNIKGETIDEITAFATEMRRHGIKVQKNQEVLEIVGTGGDHSNSFNISTTSSIVASALGVPVAKHGNRAMTSKSGSADLLEALGVNISISPEKSAKLLEEIGICFLFAQKYHIAMKHVAPVRRELPIRTVFNVLGPLLNPAGANMQLMGVYDETLVEPMAKVLSNLGIKSSMVVYGQDGFDEISISAPTSVCEVRNGMIKSYVITPEQFGFTRCKKEDLIGGLPEENARITMDILNGVKGPMRDAVILNSAAALYIAKQEITLEEAIKEIKEVIDSGKALEQLNKFVKLSNEEV